MNSRQDFFSLYGAVLWRLWREQRRAIVALPLAMAALFALVVAGTAFFPGLLTGPTLHALQAADQVDRAAGLPAGAGGLPHAFLLHQAPYLLALLGGLSAATLAARTIGSDAERGSLEMLLATRHDIVAIGGATLLAAWTVAALGWGVLCALSFGATLAFDAVLHLGLSVAPVDVVSAVAMQLVMTLLSAQLTLVVTLLWPGLSRLRTGITADPTALIAALPALLAFLAANVLPHWSLLRGSLLALAAGLVLLAVGAASLRLWFRPEKFLEA
jgi:hypothetical protein